MNEGVKIVVTALLGWLLGIVTPQIVDAVRRQYDRAHVATAITSELRELSERLAASAYYIWSRHGQLTVARLGWAATVLEGARYHPRNRAYCPWPA